jgi:hypothetical protein
MRPVVYKTAAGRNKLYQHFLGTQKLRQFQSDKEGSVHGNASNLFSAPPKRGAR